MSAGFFCAGRSFWQKLWKAKQQKLCCLVQIGEMVASLAKGRFQRHLPGTDPEKQSQYITHTLLNNYFYHGLDGERNTLFPVL